MVDKKDSLRNRDSSDNGIIDFIELLLEEEDVSTLYKELCKKVSMYEHRPKYHFISEHVYNNPQFDFSQLSEKIGAIGIYNKSNNQSKEDMEIKNNFLERLNEHIILAIVQKEYIDKNIEDANAQIDGLETKLKSINKASDVLDGNVRQQYEAAKGATANIEDLITKVGNISADISTASKKANDIYSNTFTIVGIFTAIAFTVFGGIQLTSSALDKSDSIGLAIILCGFIALSIYTILIILFTGISKLTHQNNEYEITLGPTLLVLGIIVGIIIIGLLIIKYIPSIQ